MLKRLKILSLAPLITLFFGLGPMLVSAATDCTNPATTADAIQCGTDNAAGAPAGATPGSLDNTIHSIVNLISVAVGIAAVIMIIIGGFRYITSGGNQDRIKNAKNTLLYALIGLVIVALAQTIIHFVINQATVG